MVGEEIISILNVSYDPLWTLEIGHSQCPNLDKILSKGYKTIYRFTIEAEETAVVGYTEIGSDQDNWILTTEDYLTITSSSPNDKITGTHIQTIQIIGFNSSGWVFETIEMNGDVPVTSTQKYKYVLHAKALTWGANEAAAGTITICDPDPTTLLTISPEKTESNGSKMFIPAGYHGIVTDIYISHLTSAESDNGKTILRYNRKSIEGSEYNIYKVTYGYPVSDLKPIREKGCIEANPIFENDTYIDFQMKRITTGQDVSIRIYGYIYQ